MGTVPPLLSLPLITDWCVGGSDSGGMFNFYYQELA